MTISAAYSPISSTGDGSATAIPITWPFFGATTTAELKVIEVTIADGSEEELVYSTDYTVTGGSGATGTVVPAAVRPTTVKWVIRRDTTKLQETDYVENDPFPADTHETVADRAMAILQELSQTVEESLRLSEGDTSGISMLLPNTTGNGGKVIQLKPDLSGLQYGAAADLDLTLVSAFVATLLDDSDADEFWATIMATIDKSAARTALNVEVADTNIVKSDVSTTYTVGYLHTAYDNGNTGTATLTLDPALGLQQKATCTGSFTLAAAASGDGFFLELLLTMDGTGGYTVTLSGFEKEINGTIDTTASAKNLIRVTRIDGNDVIEIVQL